MNDSNIEAKAFSLQEAPHQQKKRNHIKTQARECQRSVSRRCAMDRAPLRRPLMRSLARPAIRAAACRPNGAYASCQIRKEFSSPPQ
jgi:hypothetical protein